MAQLVGAQITIDGNAIFQYSSFQLTQGIFAHHTFRLVCPAESIDGTSGNVFNQSKNLMGANLTAQISSIGSEGELRFKGIVMHVETARYSGHYGDLIITGYSPTILLDNGPHCKTWEKKAIKNIVQDVLKHFPQNALNPKITPANGETLAYTVQYKETAWQFLNRLSATYGEWLFYDGQKLMVGPPQGSTANLIYGSNLERFNMSLEVRPAAFRMMAYDYMNSEVYDGSPKSIAGKAGLNELGKHALLKSEQVYSTQPKQWHNQFVTNKKQLDDFVNTRAAMQSSNMVRFDGSSGHPGVAVGGSISVSGINIANQAPESFGEYTVISVEHHCDSQGNYTNDLVAIPASVKFPPVSMYTEPHCETQSAFVTDNHDVKGLGRVRVKFHWMNGAEKSPWLRVTTPHAGGGKGMFTIPEVGEEVIVGFEGDNATKPYIIGAVYHGKANNTYSNGANDVKAMQSRSGNKVVMNDKDGSVHVSDSKGNDMMMDGAGNINVQSSESMVFTCGKSKIEMQKDGNITINGKDITASATDTATIIGTNNATMGSGGASFVADGKKNDASMGAMKANINGGAETNVNSGAKTVVSSTGKVAVQGAIVALN